MAPVVILGSGGRLGSELVARLGPRGVGLDRARAPLGDGEALERTLLELRPAAVINAAAYNKVDLAESRHQDALEANFSGPAQLAEICRRNGWRFCHISTDYVFGADGLERPRRPSDPPAPLSFYGFSKLAGEEAVLLRNPEALVLRVAHLWGSSAAAGSVPPDLVVRMLEQARRGEPVRVTRGQWLNPTAVPEIARACLALLRRRARGLIHLTGAAPCTITDFAAAVLRHAGIEGGIIEVESDPRPAPRAACTVLASPARPYPGVSGVGDWRRTLPAYVKRLVQA